MKYEKIVASTASTIRLKCLNRPWWVHILYDFRLAGGYRDPLLICLMESCDA